MPTAPQHLFPHPDRLGDLRERIDALDSELLRLLAQRAEAAQEIGRIKRTVRPTGPLHAPERERQVLARVAATATGAFPREAATRVFREIMSGCLALEQPLRVAFLGPEGTFSHQAARRLYGGSVAELGQATVAGVFEAVARGRADLGVVPVENATEGSVDATLDAFLEWPLPVTAELSLPVELALLLPEGAALADVRTVHSHPMGLAQCRRWLEAHLPTAALLEATSTAAAARRAALDPAAAAIGPAALADRLALQVGAPAIQDMEGNATRFLVIGGEAHPRTDRDRTTLLLKAPDGPGALLKLLEPFARFRVNLSRILSRHTRRKAWDVAFFVDAEAHRDDPPLQAALGTLKALGAEPQVLGSYPRSA
ncbi:MAG TPA: prephenate dehydratase [Holophagaceae bacterium]|nr:prephenate dehydratase [Holophagaceae bacterium]